MIVGVASLDHFSVELKVRLTYLMIVIRFQTTTTAKAARRRQNELPKRNKRVMLGNKFLMRSPGGIRDASGLSSPRSSLKFMMRTIST